MQSISAVLENAYSDDDQITLPSTESYEKFMEENTRHYHHTREQECKSASISYERIDKTHYRLCSTFEVLPEGTDVEHYPYRRFEVQEVGKNCFDAAVKR